MNLQRGRADSRAAETQREGKAVSDSVRSWQRGLAALAILVAAGAWLVAAETPSARDTTHEAGPSGGAKPEQRIREGGILTDVVGYFKATGDRATFYAVDGKQRFGCLENLNLERVATVLGEASTPLEWSVSGQVTEFRGSNYLLITRAIVRHKPTAPAADRVPAARSPDATDTKSN